MSRQALSEAEVAEINGYVDSLGSIKPHGEWYDNVEVHSYYSRQSQDNSYGIMDKKVEIDDGFNLQHIYEAGPVFESLIDHQSWYDLVEYYLGRGTPFMHELFLNVRGPGGYIGVHSGGPRFDGRGWGVSAVPEGEEELEGGSGKAGVEWSVGYMSLIIALRDIGPGDGTQNTRSPLRNCHLRKSPGLPQRRCCCCAMQARRFWCRGRTSRCSSTRRSSRCARRAPSSRGRRRCTSRQATPSCAQPPSAHVFLSVSRG